ncbi:MAG: CDP-alcohol phosphatidyltransferase family protein [Candidatus Omnitrophica bacterium]|nr:CDP-alcohol phosphatidyltransferase family protein [Candidatus Omnitrophota bacterium]
MNLANKVSTFRILSVPFFIASILYYDSNHQYLRWVALAIFLAAVISDAIDGFIARTSKQHSSAGLILDPLGDKLLLISAFICLYFVSFPIRFPLFVVFIVISRDLLIILGVVVLFMVKQRIDIRPTWWGKLTTTFQMLSVISILLQLKISFIFWSIAIIFTIISGIDYIVKGFKLLYANDNHISS